MSGETFGTLVRRLRTERGLSQNQLALQAGVDPAYVNRMERAGERDANGALIRKGLPGRDVIFSLSEALDLSYAERDRFLFAAGLAPETDWQARCEDVEAALYTVREAVGVLTNAVEPIALRRQVG